MLNRHVVIRWYLFQALYFQSPKLIDTTLLGLYFYMFSYLSLSKLWLIGPCETIAPRPDAFGAGNGPCGHWRPYARWHAAAVPNATGASSHRFSALPCCQSSLLDLWSFWPYCHSSQLISDFSELAATTVNWICGPERPVTVILLRQSIFGLTVDIAFWA